jgi:hypothetical protein
MEPKLALAVSSHSAYPFAFNSAKKFSSMLHGYSAQAAQLAICLARLHLRISQVPQYCAVVFPRQPSSHPFLYWGHFVQSIPQYATYRIVDFPFVSGDWHPGGVDVG